MKRRQHGVDASTIAKVVALSLFIGGSGVGYVFQKSQINALDLQKKANDDLIEDLKMHHAIAKNRVEGATSRQGLEARARQFSLPLGKPGYVIELPEPRLGPNTELNLAVHD